VVPHEPFRQDVIEISALLDGHVRPDEPWKLTNLFVWYKHRFLPALLVHHDAEEEIMFPEVAKRVAVPPKATADHRTLVAKMREIEAIADDYLARGGEDPTPALAAETLPKIREEWRAFRALLLPHLEEEEFLFVGPIKDAFTKAEFDAIVQRIARSEGPAAARIVLPWIEFAMHRWAPAPVLDEFHTNVPGVLLFLSRTFWMPAFLRYHRAALDSLRAGAPKTLVNEFAGGGGARCSLM